LPSGVYGDPDKNSDLLDAYINFVKTSALLLDKTVNADAVGVAAREDFNFESSLAEVSLDALLFKK